MLNLSQEADLLSKAPMFSKLELRAFTSESHRFEPEEELFHTGEVEIMVLTEKGEELQNKLQRYEALHGPLSPDH